MLLTAVSRPRAPPRRTWEAPSPAPCPPHPVATLKSWSTKEPVAWAWFPWQVPMAWPGVAFKWGRAGQADPWEVRLVASSVAGRGRVLRQPRHILLCEVLGFLTCHRCLLRSGPFTQPPFCHRRPPPGHPFRWVAEVGPDTMQKALFLRGESLCEGMLPHYQSFLEPNSPLVRLEA